jgi:hypothetical protein
LPCVAAAPPPPAGPPITPIIPINLVDQSGYPVRNDNLTNYAYVGPNDGVQQPPEVYYAYHPQNPADTSPIDPGETAQLKNAQTGKYCRIAPLPAGYPLNRPVGTAAAAWSTGEGRGGTLGARHLLQTSSNCTTMGVICDQDTIATASILTYTGTGMTYNGVPLVQSPISHTLIVSADPACTVPGGDKISFPPAALCEWHCVRGNAMPSYALRALHAMPLTGRVCVCARVPLAVR